VSFHRHFNSDACSKPGRVGPLDANYLTIAQGSVTHLPVRRTKPPELRAKLNHRSSPCRPSMHAVCWFSLRSSIAYSPRLQQIACSAGPWAWRNTRQGFCTSLRTLTTSQAGLSRQLARMFLTPSCHQRPLAFLQGACPSTSAVRLVARHQSAAEQSVADAMI
jgi:hypothetical protein